MPYVIHIKLFKLFQYFKFQVGTRVFWFKNPRLDSAGAVRVWAVFQDSSGARSITIGDFKHLRSVYLPFSIIGAAFICPHTIFFAGNLLCEGSTCRLTYVVCSAAYLVLLIGSVCWSLLIRFWPLVLHGCHHFVVFQPLWFWFGLYNVLMTETPKVNLEFLK